jgi:cyclopropane-fatty-acyl-phospholipid synthase
MSSPQQIIEHLLQDTGVKINGPDPWDMQIHDERSYNRILSGGSLGLGEAFVEGWWDCRALDEFFFKVLGKQLDKRLPFNLNALFQVLKARLFNQQTRSRSKTVALRHYDIGNELYGHMLDKRMMYSCAYWANAKNLDEAQEHKLELICRKLQLEKGMRLLDIGCGWGGLAQYAAEKYQVSVVGITLSEQQAIIARQTTAGLPVEIRLQDYRDLHEKFDRIVSVGMFEHVGYKNYGTFMKAAFENMAADGIFLLHTIGGNGSVKNTDPWIDKYIFPNSMLPSAEQIVKAFKGLFLLEDWHNFGLYYDRTCMEWLNTFKRSWPALSNRYDDAFYRMWTYYLNMCAASFRVRKNQLWQIVLTKRERLNGYQSIR